MPQSIPTPLSQIRLWKQQRVFYERMGRDAWRGGFVPEYITSNPFIAHTYAQLVLAWWQDCREQGRLNPQKPCYLIELGAGSGRFAYLFLHRLTELLVAEQAGETDELSLPRFVYIMTDLAAANLAAWQANPRLAHFVAQGQLDFARFDVTRDQELLLIRNDVRLNAGTLENPAVVIANYVFDSIPSDLYYAEKGELFQRLITEQTPEPAESETGLPVQDMQANGAGEPVDEPASLTALEQHLAQIELGHGHHPFTPDADEHTPAAEILARHAKKLDKTVFPLPVAALETWGRLRELAGEPLLILVGDKGYVTWAGLQDVGNPDKAVPGMAFHSGCFSVMLNFLALAHYAEEHGGAAWLPDHEPHRLGVAAYVLDKNRGEETAKRWSHTRRAFAAHVNQFGPDDFYVLAQTLESQLHEISFVRLLALLRLSHWDPQLLAGALPALLGWLDELSPAEWETLRAAIAATMQHDYPSTTRYDLAYGLGRLFFARQNYADALVYYSLSQEHQDANTQMLYEVAVCQLEVGRPAEAAATLDEVLSRAANHQAARDLRAYLRRKTGY